VTFSPEANQIVLSVNPKAGRRAVTPRIEKLIDLLKNRGFTVTILTDLEEVAACANTWHEECRLRALVGVGGDGTAAELVNRTKPGVPLAIMPAGTENLLARYIGWSHHPEELAETLAFGQLRHMDAGLANGRIFLVMVGCGFDADVVRRLDTLRKGHISYSTWIRPVFETIQRYEYPKFLVYWNEAKDDSSADMARLGSARWLFAFNLPCYGGGLRFVPEAEGTDGLLDVCLFRRGSFFHGLRYLVGVLAGRHRSMTDCTTARVRRLRLTAKQEVPYQLDGDPGGVLPLDVEVLPDRITLVVPPRNANVVPRGTP